MLLKSFDGDLNPNIVAPRGTTLPIFTSIVPASPVHRDIWMMHVNWSIRSRLRDFRMIAQSRNRMAECYVSLGNIAWRWQRQKKLAINWLKRAESEATWVRDFYSRIPQEDHRNKDVQSVLEDIKTLREEIHAAAV